MNGAWLREQRERKRWTQEQAAARLGVSQTYLSLLENGRRPVSKSLAQRLERRFAVPATVLPVATKSGLDNAQSFVEGLAALGYPGFTHFNHGRRVNPARLLLDALRMHDLEPRLSEALPWVAWHYADLDWDWVVREAKLHDLQNRLGFVVGLARQVAERKEQQATAGALAAVEQRLERSRLAREDTLGHESMTQAERRWLRERRSTQAQHWNLLTSLVPDHLSYAS
jgi:transcriptional regulator with XRE-family HTH domain